MDRLVNQFKNYTMKQLGVLMLFLSVLVIVSCDKDEDEVSDRFRFLTSVDWESDSLLVNGMEAGGDGQMLENFRGTARFNEDGTGSFGGITGTWAFSQDETELIINTEELPFALTTKIIELTASSLKVTANFPNPLNPVDQLKIRMTFKAQ